MSTYWIEDCWASLLIEALDLYLSTSKKPILNYPEVHADPQLDEYKRPFNDTMPNEISTPTARMYLISTCCMVASAQAPKCLLEWT